MLLAIILLPERAHQVLYLPICLHSSSHVKRCLTHDAEVHSTHLTGMKQVCNRYVSLCRSFDIQCFQMVTDICVFESKASNPLQVLGMQDPHDCAQVHDNGHVSMNDVVQRREHFDNNRNSYYLKVAH